MVASDGGQPSSGLIFNFQTVISLSFPSTQYASILNPTLPEGKSFVDSVKTNFEMILLKTKSLLKDITYVEGMPQVN